MTDTLPPHLAAVRAQERRTAVRAATRLVVALAAVGAVLGAVWAAWSPAGPRGYVLAPGVVQPDEVETWASSDARYALLAAAAGLVAALLAWTRRAERGPAVVAALAVGGLAGSLLQWAVGRLLGGGTTDGATGSIIRELPLSLHATALLVLEPAVAVLVVGLVVAFAGRDDLGRPDPLHEHRTHSGAPVGAPAGASVGAGDHPQHGGGDGDAPRGLQQGDLPPQQA